MVTPVAATFLSAAFSLRSRSSSAFRSSSDIVTPCQLEMSHWAEEFIGGLSQVQTLLENFSLSAWYEARSIEHSVLRTKHFGLNTTYFVDGGEARPGGVVSSGLHSST